MTSIYYILNKNIKTFVCQYIVQWYNYLSSSGRWMKLFEGVALNFLLYFMWWNEMYLWDAKIVFGSLPPFDYTEISGSVWRAKWCTIYHFICTKCVLRQNNQISFPCQPQLLLHLNKICSRYVNRKLRCHFELMLILQIDLRSKFSHFLFIRIH